MLIVTFNRGTYSEQVTFSNRDPQYTDQENPDKVVPNHYIEQVKRHAKKVYGACNNLQVRNDIGGYYGNDHFGWWVEGGKAGGYISIDWMDMRKIDSVVNQVPDVY